jgi:hypothetical protein
MEEMVHYLKIHLISLEQDLEKINYVNEHHFYLVKQAEIKLTSHLLSVAEGILEKYYDEEEED